jgi:hypothetical protein
MASVWSLHHKGLIGGVLQRLVPISTEELELCQSDHWDIGHLPEQGPFSPNAKFGLMASSRKSLGGSKLLPLKIMEATVYLVSINASEMFW